MVREKRKRKSNQEKDFEKKKVRVGRRLSKKTASKYNNVVDTSLTTKRLEVNSNKSAFEEARTLAISIAKFLPLTDHHNKNTRKGAYENMLKLLQDSSYAEDFPKELLAPIVDKIRSGLLAKEGIVRQESLKLFMFLFSKESKVDLEAFLDIVTLQIVVAVTSLSRGIRLTGMKAFRHLLKENDVSDWVCSKYFGKLFDAFATSYTITLEIVGIARKKLEEHVQYVLGCIFFLIEFVLRSNRLCGEWSSIIPKESSDLLGIHFVQEVQVREEIRIKEERIFKLIDKTFKYYSLSKQRNFPCFQQIKNILQNLFTLCERHSIKIPAAKLKLLKHLEIELPNSVK